MNLCLTEIFMVEALGSAVIDTACTRTVCGGKWLEDYTSGLPQSELLKIDDKVQDLSYLVMAKLFTPQGKLSFQLR